MDGFADDFIALPYEPHSGKGPASADYSRQSSRRLERARAGEGKREVERLLLDVFSSLPEPDSIYGVPAPAADLSAQATAYAHEGGWQNTLPAYDTLLQHPSSGAVAATAAVGAANGLTGGGAGGIGLQTGIATCLQVRGWGGG